jgi:hypothetical protein
LFSIEAPTPELSASTRMTFAPAVMHWSACERCVFWSPSAFRMRDLTPAALKAAERSGRSNSS